MLFRSYCMLNVPQAEQYTGAGVYYGAALTEAMACANETVYIVGGANSAGQAAMHFSRYADKVHMLIRGESLTKSMSKYLIDQIEGTPNIVVETGTGVTSVKKGDHVIPLYTPECRNCPSCLSRKTNLCTAIRATQGQGVMPDGSSRFSARGEKVHHYMGCSTLANFTVLPEIAERKSDRTRRSTRSVTSAAALPPASAR